MPRYRRKRKYTTRRRFKRRYKRRRRRRVTSARYALSLAKRNASLLRGNKKWADTMPHGYNVDYAGYEIDVLQTLNGATGIIEGTGSHDRVGEDIRMTSLDIRGFAEMSSGDVSISGAIRVIVSGYKIDIPLGSSYLDNQLQLTSSTLDLTSFYKMDPKYRWQLFFDRQWELSPYAREVPVPAGTTNTGNDGSKKRKYFRVNLRWPKGRPMHFTGPAAPSPTSGKIVMCMVSERTPHVGHPITASFWCRAKWYG